MCIRDSFGTERNPGSGSADPNHRSDSQHPTLFIETKYRAKHTALTLLRETRKIAEKENKTAVCCLAEKGKKGFGVLIHSEDLDDFVKEFIDTAVIQHPMNELSEEYLRPKQLLLPGFD